MMTPFLQVTILSFPSHPFAALKKIVFSFPKEDWGRDGWGVKEKISQMSLGGGRLMLRLEFEIEIVKLLLVLFYRW